MALITISGYPSSGKTRRVNELKAYFEQALASSEYSGPKLKIVVISDDSLNIKRDVYNGE
jgi:protein KTI12